MTLNGINTIIFDLDGTLRHNRPEGHTVFWEYAATLGAPGDFENRREAQRWGHQYWTNSGPLIEDLDAFGRDTPEFWLNYAQRHLIALGCPPELARDLALPVNMHMREKYQPEDWVEPETPEMLAELKDQGYVLGVATNRGEPIDEYLGELGLHSFFDFFFAAGEIGYWKPDRRVFEHALKLAGAPAESSLYIGDNYFADVIGSQDAGLRPVLVDPVGYFPEADCPVVSSILDLPSLLTGKLQADV